MHEKKIYQLVKVIVQQWEMKNFSQPLTKARLTKLVYLFDWFYALKKLETFSGIDWYFNHYGPYVSHVIDIVEKKISDTDELSINVNHSKERRWTTISKGSKFQTAEIDDEAKELLNRILEETGDNSYDNFLSFVYSTYPVLQSTKYEKINLVGKARELREKKNQY